MDIPLAPSNARLVAQCTLYLAGPREERRSAIGTVLAHLASDPHWHGHFRWQRTGTQRDWTPRPSADALTEGWLDGRSCRRLEWASEPDGQGALLRIVDVDAVLGQARATSITLQLPDDEAAAGLARWARWAVAAVPLHWGVGGWSFVADGPRPDLSWDRVAERAKRLWAVQLPESETMQWDAMRGITSVGWLTLVGQGLAESSGLVWPDPNDLADDAVYLRTDRYGAVFAAGGAPSTGDLHAGPVLRPYRRVDEVLRPIRLSETRPMGGVFRDQDVRDAWLGRFQDPDAWMRADIARH